MLTMLIPFIKLPLARHCKPEDSNFKFNYTHNRYIRFMNENNKYIKLMNENNESMNNKFKLSYDNNTSDDDNDDNNSKNTRLLIGMSLISIGILHLLPFQTPDLCIFKFICHHIN